MSSRYRDLSDLDAQNYLNNIQASTNPNVGGALANKEAEQMLEDRKKKQVAQDTINTRFMKDQGAETEISPQTGTPVLSRHEDGAVKFKPEVGEVKPIAQTRTRIEPITDEAGNRIGLEQRNVPNYNVMLGRERESGAYQGENKPTRQGEATMGGLGITTEAQYGQTGIDDRGNPIVVPTKPTLDPKTGFNYVEMKDPVTGETKKVNQSVDLKESAKLGRKMMLDDEAAQLDMRENAIKQQKLAITPTWEPVKKEYDEAKADVEKLPNELQRRGDVWVKVNPETGVETMATPFEVARRKEVRDQAQSRLSTAEQQYGKLSPQVTGLEQAESDAAAKKLEIEQRKIRLVNDLPEDDGEVSTVLAWQSHLDKQGIDSKDITGTTPERYKEVVDHIRAGGQMGADGTMVGGTLGDPNTPMMRTEDRPDEDAIESAPIIPNENFAQPKPLLTPESNQEAIKSAFGALRGIESLNVETKELESSNGTKSQLHKLTRDGVPIAYVTNGGFAPIVELTKQGRSQADIMSMVNLGQTQGIPLYMQSNLSRKRLTDEATDVAAIFAADKNPDLYDANGKATPKWEAEMKRLGAGSPIEVMQRVDQGELSVQHGQAILKEVFGATMETTNPKDPKEFAKWVAETTKAAHTARAERNLARGKNGKETNTTADRLNKARNGLTPNFEEQDTLKKDFLVDQWTKNAGKPGVKFSDYVRMHKEVNTKEGASFVDKGAGMAGFAGKTGAEVVGSILGLAAGAFAQSGAGIVALTGDDKAKATFDEFMKLRNLSTEQFFVGIERNRQVWFTPRGQKAMNELNLATSSFQRTIDREMDKPGAQRDQAAILAAKQQIIKGALALHALNDDGQNPITADNVDPDKDPALMASLARYVKTADPRMMEEFKSRLLSNNLGRELAVEMDKKVRNDGFFGAIEGGMYAGWQELGTELLADASMLITGGGSKALQNALRFAGATNKAMKIERTVAAVGSAIDKFNDFGIKAESLINPLTKLQKGKNFVVGAAKTGAQAFVGEAGEEMIVEAGADDPNLIQAGLIGGIGGIMLTPAFYPMQRAMQKGQAKEAEHALQIDNRKFAQSYNERNADVPGFEPITHEVAGAARQLLNVTQYDQRMAEAVKRAQAVAAIKNPTPEQQAAAQTEMLAVTKEMEALAPMSERAIDAAREIASMPDPTQRAFYSGIAKVAAGNTTSLTTSERAAVQQAQTDQGNPYFANLNGKEVITDEARAEIAMNAPLVGAIIETTESAAIAEAQFQQSQTSQTNVTNQQGQTGPQATAQAATAQAATPQTQLVGDGGGATGAGQAQGQTQAPAVARDAAVKRLAEIEAELGPREIIDPVNPGAAPKTYRISTTEEVELDAAIAAADAAPVQGGAATQAPVATEMEAAEYAAAQQADPSLPSMEQAVASAFSQGQPVSVSMATQTDISPPANYVRQGSRLVSTTSVQDGNPVTTGANTAEATDKENSGTAKTKGQNTGQNTPARQTAERVKAAVEAAFPSMKGRINIVEELMSDGNGGTRQSGGVYADDKSGISLSLPDIEREMQGVDPAAYDAILTDTVIRHEIVHVIQYEAVRAMRKSQGSKVSFDTFFREFYGKMATEFSPEVFAAAREIYGANSWDKIPEDALKAAEVVRMLVEARLNPDQADKFSELSRAIDLQASPSLIELIKTAVVELIIMVQTGKLPESARKHIEEVAAMYQAMTDPAADQAAVPTGSLPDGQSPTSRDVGDQSTGLRIEANGDTARILNGDTPLWQGKADQAQAQLEKMQEAEGSTMQLVGQALMRAFEKNPQITAKQKEQLYDLVDELEASLDGLSPDEISKEVERSITEWLDSQEETKAEVEREKAASKGRNIDTPARRKAKKLVNSGQFEAITAILDSGMKITPRPNRIGLILSRKKSGKRLTNEEIRLLNNDQDYNGALTQSMFDRSGDGAVAREVVSMLMARQGEGITPDEMAGYYRDGATSSELWEQLDKEVTAISRGKSAMEGDALDPNRERGDDDIEAELAARKARGEWVGDEEVALPSLSEIASQMDEAYGENTDLAAKLRIIEPMLESFPEPQRLAMQQAAVEEQQRIEAGVISAVRWQEMNPELGQFAAWFQRLLDNQTRESMQGAMNRLRSPKAQEQLSNMTLGSSPSNQRSLDFGVTGDMGTRNQLGFDFAAMEPLAQGPRAKVKENAQAAFDKLPEQSPGRNQIAGDIARREGLAEPQAFIEAATKPAEPPKKASTQINLPPAIAKQIMDFSATIPDSEISSTEENTGRETEPHVTVLYGLTSDNANQATKALAGMGSIEVKLGKMSLFENEQYDVLKIDVISDGLRSANKALRDKVDFENDYPDYQPHVTIAYLKPGEGKKYAGMDNFEGIEFESDEILHSGKQREKTPISLKPTAKELLTLQAKPNTDEITDFGEKIGGAKKDYAQAFAEAKTFDIASEPFSKVWPEPTYKKLIADGIDPYVVGFIRAMRDEVPVKPRRWGMSTYIQQVETLRGLAEGLISGEISQGTFKEMLRSPKYENLNNSVGGRAELYQEVGHEQSLKGFRFRHTFYNLYKGVEKVWKWEITKPAKATAFGNMPMTLAEGNSREEVLEKFKALVSGKDLSAKPKIKFDIYSYRNKPGYILGKKIGRHHADLFTFETAKEARAYLNENYDDVIARLESYKKIGEERRTENAPRIGADHLQGRNITPKMFQDAFGFRGVEFGNYVEQKRRQSDLNRAYEALMDLAGILNIPPQALSLDGTLGLAFGARGSGGKNAAAAHYEPGKVVINLTKNNGPGSLAHELFHAMDNYFLRQVGKPQEYATAQRGKTWGARLEVMEAFGNIIKTIDQTGLRKRSMKLDNKRSTPYWSTDIELSARAFENYVIARMQAAKSSNDYLVNIADISAYAESMIEAMFEGNTAQDLYPYLTDDEIGPVVEAFDQLFDKIETKPTEKGIALYSSPGIPRGEQQDLFTAVSKPDAKEVLGDVKAGRMHALNAYRALTAKRAAGRTLTAEEEQQLLDAETALGQKLAFDMEELRQESDPEPTEPQPPTSRPRADQQDMMLGGETLKGGQITLFSSPTPGSFRQDLILSFAKPATEYNFKPSDERRETIQRILSKYSIRSVYSEDLQLATRRFEEATGTAVVYYTGGTPTIGGFTSPDFANVLLINVDTQDVPLSAILAHELTHAAQKDANTDTAGLYRRTVSLLTPKEHAGIFQDLLDAGYTSAQQENETTAHLMGDIMAGDKSTFLSGMEKAEEIRSLYEDFFDGMGFLKPSALKDVPNDDLLRLLSSLSPDDSAAVQEALAKMPPIYRKVFEAVNDGDSPAKIAEKFELTDRAVTNILNQVNSRIRTATTAADADLTPKMKEGKIDGGRPDLAGSTNKAVAAIDQIRNESGIPDKRGWGEVNAQAEKMLKDDYQGTYDKMLDKARNLEQMTDLEVAATKRIIARETMEGRITTPEERTKMAMLIHGYRDIGTETARSLAIRRDPDMKPAERHAQFIAEALFSPDPKTRARLRKSSPTDQQSILAGWMSRVDTIKGELKARGIDLDASLAAFNARKQEMEAATELSPRTAEIIEESIRKLTKREKTIVEALRAGSTTYEGAAYLTGVTKEEAKAIYTAWVNGIKASMKESAQRYLATTLGSSPSNMMSDILDELGVVDPDMIAMDEADRARVQAEKAKREPEKARKPRKKKEKSADETSDQQEDVLELESEPLPINETTGTFDLNDPMAMKEVVQAFSVARHGLGDKLMEYWRMSILSGPHTHIVNTGSNLMHAAYRLIPRRAVEGAANSALSMVGLGSKESATLSEFSAMSKNLRKAAGLAARIGLRVWKTEERMFEEYATQVAKQVEFTGMGAEQFAPAVGGKFGKIMRSLSFRAMTTADEFIKGFVGQLEAAAQAHRIAKVEEKLSGEAYAKRITELMEPGSIAWVRAMDEVNTVTFQTPLDGTNPQTLARIDQIAELAKTARNLPWIGKPLTFFIPFIDTPTNIFKEAIKMTPLGLALATIDGARALNRKFNRGELTKEEANLEAGKLYNRARLVDDVTNQTIGIALYFAVASLLEGDEDDDRPFITGTQPYKTTRRGERDNAYAVMPEQSIRLGSTTLSYRRWEPFATVLSSLVDLARETEANGGEMDASVVSAWIGGHKNQLKDKTFLQGIGSLMDAFEDPDRFLTRISTNIVTGFVPNIIRQPIRTADPMMRDATPRGEQGFFESVARGVGYSVVPAAAPEKMDVWGNPIRKNRGQLIGGSQVTDSALRILDPTNITVNPDIDPIDRWIFRYNMMTADSQDRIAIQPISDKIAVTMPGEKRQTRISLTVEEQAEANRRAGQAARQMLGNDWDKTPHTEQNAKRIIETVREVQTAERARLRMEKLTKGDTNNED